MKGHKLLYGASVLMVLGFVINLAIDHQQYQASFTSAPFWVWILTDALLWLVPALIAFVAGLVAKRKLIKKENTK